MSLGASGRDWKSTRYIAMRIMVTSSELQTGFVMATRVAYSMRGDDGTYVFGNGRCNGVPLLIDSVHFVSLELLGGEFLDGGWLHLEARTLRSTVLCVWKRAFAIGSERTQSRVITCYVSTQGDVVTSRNG